MPQPLILAASGTAPRAIIFDLDGTLVDSAWGIEECLRAVSVQKGRGRVRSELVRALVSRGVAELVSQNLDTPDEASIADDVAAFRGVYAHRRTPPEELYPGVAAGLSRLASSLPALGICTNKPQHLSERVLADTGIAPLFKVVVGGDAAPRSKPDAAHVAAVATGLGIALEDCILVGDSEVDGAAASAAGIPFVLMTYGYAIGGDIAADHRFDTFDDLSRAFLDTLASGTP